MAARTHSRHPRASEGSWADRRDRPEGEAGAATGHKAVDGREDELLLAQRPQEEANVVYGEAGAGHIDFWMAFSDVIIIVRRLIREAWTCYRWETRPSRRP